MVNLQLRLHIIYKVVYAQCVQSNKSEEQKRKRRETMLTVWIDKSNESYERAIYVWSENDLEKKKNSFR